MMKPHPLLARQLKRHFGDPGAIPEELAPFLESIDSAYREFDFDRAMLERTLELSSRELLQANAGMRAVFQAFPDLFIWVGPDDRVVNVKAGAKDDLLLSSRSLLGKRIQDHPDKAVARKFGDALERTRRTQASTSIEYGLEIGGSHKAYEARLLPLVDGQVISIIRNITKRKRAEHQLLVAMRNAKAAMRAKGEFLAMMSHEIRTPMNAVVGMAGLLLETELSYEQRDYAETVRHSADALLTVINDILDYSKFEAGKIDLEELDFDVRGIVQETIDLLGNQAVTRKRELFVLVDPSVPYTLAGDAGRIRQVLLNLLNNAVKFTAEGEITVRVRLKENGDETALVHFSVEDTGIGISRDVKPLLFEPFTQADSSTTRKFGGTGLGLAICRRIAEHMGGAIGCESEVGEGSRFWFTVRLRTRPDAVAKRPGIAPDLRGTRVLVVDDIDLNRRLLELQLGSQGIVVTSAGSAAEAMIALDEAARAGNLFELIMLDHHMPGADGLSLARTIKACRDFATIPLVLFTSGPERSMRPQIEALGFAGYLAKPIRETHLYRCIGMVLGEESDSAARQAQLVTEESVATDLARDKRRVLVAEDNIINQKVAARMLEKLGYLVDVVADGKEALEAVRRLAYDAVLMDCQMPEMDGYESAAAIRQLEGERRDTPIIALTADALQGDRERCLRAGMNDYLSKPVKCEDLSATLERWTARSGARGTTA